MSGKESHNKEEIFRLAESLEQEGKWDEALRVLEEIEGMEHGAGGRGEPPARPDKSRESEVRIRVEELRARIEEKKKIYGKVKSVIGDGERKSYIGADDFVTMVKDEISIRYHIKNKDLDLEEIFRAIKRARVKVGTALGFYPEKILIEVYDSFPEMKAKGKEETGNSYINNISGVFDGKIRIDSSKLCVNAVGTGHALPLQIYVLITHEYVHLVLFEMTKAKYPQWLSEGLAVFFSQDLSNYYEEILAEAVKEDSILPLELLEGDFKKFPDEKLIKLAYSQSYSIVSYLVEKLGWEKIRFILENLKFKGTEKTLNDLSLNYYLIEQDWKRWVKKLSR